MNAPYPICDEKKAGSCMITGMCGISVVFGPKDHPAHQHAKAHNIVHRGPDGTGLAFIDLPGGRVSMLVHRLAIVGGDQVQIPYLHRGSMLVAFNGEIYNWRQLRSILNCNWKTDCDVEVLAEALWKWGSGALDRIDGQFAFAAANQETGNLYLARDRAGEKSLYWTTSDDSRCMLAASEIKALDVPLVHEYCRELDLYEFDCQSTTPFDHVYTFPPAHCVIMDSFEGSLPGQISYWKLPDPGSVDGRISLTRVIRKAVEDRIPSNIPWTILVSGGLDSAILQAIGKAPVVYTVAFDYPGFDDTPAAKIAAGDAELRIVTFTKEEALEALHAIAWHLDTPATWTALNQWFLAKRMKQDGFKICFSGEGADEVFGGYTRNLLLNKIQELFKDPVLGDQYRPMSERVIGDACRILARMHCRSDNDTDLDRVESDIVPFLDECNGDMIEASRRFEWHYTMQVLLRQTDRMFMAHGIELRCPFLARELVEYGYGVGGVVVNHDGQTKPELRRVAEQLFIPKSITRNRNKRGFAVPWNLWHQDGAQGSRGQWSRDHFAKTMYETWRKVFFSNPR